MAVYCPVCTKKFQAPRINGSGFLGNQKCDFCKTVFSIHRDASGVFETNDIEWEEMISDITLNEHIVKTKLDEIKDALVNSPGNIDLLEKLRRLEEQRDQLSVERKAKYDEYEDRQSDWQEKYEFRNE
jgi:hypothetical protein